MEVQERIKILELAWDITKVRVPPVGNLTEASIKEWHKLFDQTYKAIQSTALDK